MLLNPIATFSQVIGRLTASNQSWAQVGTWFGNEADNLLIGQWMGVSMVLQMTLAIVLVLWTVRSVEQVNKNRPVKPQKMQLYGPVFPTYMK